MPHLTRALPDLLLDDIRQAYKEKNYMHYMVLIVEAMRLFCTVNFGPMQPKTEKYVDEFLEVFLDTFTGKKFRIAGMDEEYFVRLNPVIANIVAMSRFKTADKWLAQLDMRTKGHRAKILTLVCPRTSVQVDYDTLEKDSLATLWWSLYPTCTGSIINPRIEKNLRNHFRAGPFGDFPQTTQFTDIHFVPTYADHDGAPLIKARINECVRKKWPPMKITNNPDPKRIAIISDRWAPNTVVHRSVAPLINALKGPFKLDLFHLNKDAGDLKLDTEGFEKVHFIHTEGNDFLGLEPLLDNQYAAIIYPDVGMNSQSIILANQRFAPIQVLTTGHPVSTVGTEIDFFISGDAVESSEAYLNYSERLVLLPGMGNQSVRPTYELTNPERETDIVLINACWGPSKYNRDMLTAVRAGMMDAKHESRVHFFPSSGICRYNGLNAFLTEIHDIFEGGSARVLPDNGGYAGYMARLEWGDFGIDSFPFGGYNTIIDQLHVGKPVITLQGDHWYNRASSAVNRMLNMPELIAESRYGYQKLITRMIDDEEFRQEMRQRVQVAPMDEKIYDNISEPAHFVAAMDYLIEHHPDPNFPHPVYISPGETI